MDAFDVAGIIVAGIAFLVIVVLVVVGGIKKYAKETRRQVTDALARAANLKEVTDKQKARLDRHAEIYGSQNDRLNVLDESVPALTDRLTEFEGFTDVRLTAIGTRVAALEPIKYQVGDAVTYCADTSGIKNGSRRKKAKKTTK